MVNNNYYVQTEVKSDRCCLKSEVTVYCLEWIIITQIERIE